MENSLYSPSGINISRGRTSADRLAVLQVVSRATASVYIHLGIGVSRRNCGVLLHSTLAGLLQGQGSYKCLHGRADPSILPNIVVALRTIPLTSSP